MEQLLCQRLNPRLLVAIIRTNALVPAAIICPRLAGILGARSLRYRTSISKKVEGSKPLKRIQEFSTSNAVLQSLNPHLRTGAHLNASINSLNPPRRM